MGLDLLTHALGAYAFSFTIQVGGVPSQYAAPLTVGLGMAKEYWIDERPSSADMVANGAGIAISVLAHEAIRRAQQ
jgi:hypothetical protein